MDKVGWKKHKDGSWQAKINDLGIRLVVTRDQGGYIWGALSLDGGFAPGYEGSPIHQHREDAQAEAEEFANRFKGVEIGRRK